jgi:hypothetical protein
MKRSVVDLNEVKWGIPHMVRIGSVMSVILFVVSSLMGCATESSVQIPQPFKPARFYKIHIDQCVNRTDYRGKHDLEDEATRALVNKIKGSGLLEIDPESNFILTCNIERFAKGSALKRWVVPGWGTTNAEVSVMIWEKLGEKVLVMFRSQASVEAGGLYTIGADKYILNAAFNDIVKQLKAWLNGLDSPSETKEEK